jgi:hypothetical protein
MSEEKKYDENMVMIPCGKKGCDFDAVCLVTEPEFTRLQALRACRKVLYEHDALHHSSKKDRERMIKKLGLTGPDYKN